MGNRMTMGASGGVRTRTKKEHVRNSNKKEFECCEENMRNYVPIYSEYKTVQRKKTHGHGSQTRRKSEGRR